MTEHRGALLSAALRRFEDPEKSRDPRVRAVAAQLTALEPADIAPAPRAHFRAELRAQLVAVAPRIVAESAQAEQKKAAEPAEDRRRSWLPRPVALVGAALVVLLVLGGGAVWLSQRALPGDALYGLKRASESFRLALASSDTAKANDYLEFAGRRIDEAQALVAHEIPSAAGIVAAQRLSPQTTALVRSNLGSSDADVRSASQLLGDQAVSSHSADPLSSLTSWAPAQLQRLRQLAAQLPQSPLRGRALASAHLVHQAQARATALSRAVGCRCLARTSSDQLGPVPCHKCTPATQPGHRHHNRPTPGVPGPGVGSGGPVGSGVPQPTTSTGAGHGGRHGHHGGTGSGTTSLPAPLPSLPLPSLTLPTSPSLALPSLPLSVASCGSSVDLLGLSVPAGTCTKHR